MWEQVAPVHVVRKESLEIKRICPAAAEHNSVVSGSGVLGRYLWPQAAWVPPGWAHWGPCGFRQPSCPLAGLTGAAQPQALRAAPAALCPLHRPLYVTVVYQGKCSHCMRIGVAVPMAGTVARLREAVSSETKIPTEQVTGRAHHPALSGMEHRSFHPMLGVEELNRGGGLGMVWMVLFPVCWPFAVWRWWESRQWGAELPDCLLIHVCWQPGSHCTPMGNSSLGRASGMLSDPTKTPLHTAVTSAPPLCR